jgi:hypothetical protein
MWIYIAVKTSDVKEIVSSQQFWTNTRHFKLKYTPILINNQLHLLCGNKVSGGLRKGADDNIWT